MEPVVSSNISFNIYKIDSITGGKFKGAHIYLEKIENITHVHVISTLEKPFISSRKRRAEPEDLSDILNYYTDIGKNAEGSKKIVKIIQKLLQNKSILKDGELNNSEKTYAELSINNQKHIPENVYKNQIEKFAAIELRFLSGSEMEKNSIFLDLLETSISDFNILNSMTNSYEIFEFFKVKFEKTVNEEYLIFILNCLNYFKESNKKNAEIIVYLHINPDSDNAINIPNAESSFQELCKLLKDYEENQEMISLKVTSYLKEMLKHLHQNFSTCL